MTNKLHLILAAGSMLSTMCVAQQSLNPQPTQLTPCPTQQAHKPSRFHFNLPPVIQEKISKIQVEMGQKTGVQVDVPGIIHDATEKKPCQLQPVTPLTPQTIPVKPAQAQPLPAAPTPIQVTPLPTPLQSLPNTPAPNPPAVSPTPAQSQPQAPKQ
jgi:hypothetical protein